MRVARPSLTVGLAAATALLVLVTLPASAGADGGTTPVFADGMAQPVFTDSSKWVHHELWVETSFDSDADGQPDRVHVDVSRPGETETEGLKVPVVYESSPYYAGTPSTAGLYWFHNTHHEVGQAPPPRLPAPAISRRNTSPTISTSHESTWIPLGFAVVHSESPGTGLSEGCPTVGGTNESLAPKAVIDWLNGRARGFTTIDGDVEVTAGWSTGRVGMTGTSYNGTLPVAAASTGVEGLEAIIPVAPVTSWYEYYRSNGLVRAPGGYQGEDMDVLFDYINSGVDAQHCASLVRPQLEASIDRVTGDRTPFWASRDYMADIDQITAATLMAHAFGDWNVKPINSVRIFEALKEREVPTQLYMHQGGHGGAPPTAMMNRWFTRYLYQVENDVELDPLAWVVREGVNRLEPTAYADYPNPAAVDRTFGLTAGGLTEGGLREGLTGVGTEMLVDGSELPAGTLATLAASPNRLRYSTAPLTAPMHVSGVPSVTLRMASSKSATNLSVYLYALQGNSATLVTRGWADPQNHTSVDVGEPLVPDMFYDVTVALEPDDQIIPAGSRLSLVVMASDPDFTIRPLPGTQLSVDLSATSLSLPVVQS